MKKYLGKPASMSQAMWDLSIALAATMQYRKPDHRLTARRSHIMRLMDTLYAGAPRRK